MTTKFTWKYALVAVGVLATASLLAQYGGPPPQRVRPMAHNPQQQAAALDSLRAYLGLSDAQVLQLQDMSAQSRAAMKTTSEKIRANQAALHEMLSSGAAPDEAKTGRLVLDTSALRNQLQAARQDLVQKSTALLTPDQQQKLSALPSMAQAQRQASPGTMPEAWPMLHAAAQLGLIAPPARGERMGMGAGSRPAAGAAPASQN